MLLDLYLSKFNFSWIVWSFWVPYHKTATCSLVVIWEWKIIYMWWRFCINLHLATSYHKLSIVLEWQGTSVIFSLLGFSSVSLGNEILHIWIIYKQHITSLLWMLKYTHRMCKINCSCPWFFFPLLNCVMADVWKCSEVHSSNEIPYQLTKNLECFWPLTFL